MTQEMRQLSNELLFNRSVCFICFMRFVLDYHISASWILFSSLKLVATITLFSSNSLQLIVSGYFSFAIKIRQSQDMIVLDCHLHAPCRCLRSRVQWPVLPSPGLESTLPLEVLMNRWWLVLLTDPKTLNQYSPLIGHIMCPIHTTDIDRYIYN